MKEFKDLLPISKVVRCSSESPSGLVWIVDRGTKTKSGDPAGTMSKDGYWKIKHQGELYLAHRVIWFLHNGPIPAGACVDHRNRNKSDNTIGNLRIATKAQNLYNRASFGLSKTGYKGVFQRPYSRFESYINFGGKRIYLGCFSTPMDAAKAYDAKAVELFGEFACLNFEPAIQMEVR